MIAAPRQLTYNLYDVQDDFVADDDRYVAFVGGRNSGKTYSGSVKAMLHAMKPGLGAVAAPNFPMLEHGAKRQFIDRIEESGIPFVTNNQKGTLTIPDTGAEVLFVTLESESRVRGPNFNWGWVDELDYLYAGPVWKALKGAIRAGDSPQLFATSTPKGRRLIYQEWVRDATERHKLYRATTHDNPFIDAADYVAGLGYEGQFAEQEINAEFVSFEGLVYGAFSRDRNVRSVDTSDWTKYQGVDVGTRNPTVVLTIAIAGDGERVHIEREFYQRGLGSTAILDAIKGEANLNRPDMIYIDPSAAAYIDDLIADGYPVTKANNDVQTGIQRVTSALPMLTVDPSCVNTIEEFESYQYPDAGRGNSDNPIKQNDHCLVAGTMVATIDGDKAIETIQNGEMVLTRDGYREVISAGMTNPSAEVLTVQLSNGQSITGTGGHPVFANGQWVLLNELRYGDILMAPHTASIDTARRAHAPVHVERVSALTERQAVYNLTVAGTPEYFANGVLVHNCMDAIRYTLAGAMNPVINLMDFYS